MIPFKDTTGEGVFANSAALGDGHIFGGEAKPLQKSVKSQRANIAADDLTAADQKIQPDIRQPRGVIENGVAVSLAAFSAISGQIGALLLLDSIVALVNIIKFLGDDDFRCFIGFGVHLPAEIGYELLALLLGFCGAAFYRCGSAHLLIGGESHHQPADCHHRQQEQQ